MAVNLNDVAMKLRNQRSMGVNKDGTLSDKSPRNDGTKDDSDGCTTLMPEKFYLS